MTCHLRVEEMVRLVQQGGDFRVLRRVELTEGIRKSSDEFGESSIAAILDVETTGLDHDWDRIIEFAIRRIRFDPSGRLLKVDRGYSWLEDPGRPLEPEIVRVTGLMDEQLAGRAIDEIKATSLLNSADVLICHNACFDRPFVEERLPSVAGMAWACSCRDVDWSRLGLEGRSLGWLLAQRGWFHEGHRAGADVDALVTLLDEELDTGTTVLGELIAKARQPTWMLRTVGAHFDVKDRLKARGYRWDSAGGVWWREVDDDALSAEREWLSDFVYRPDLCPGCDGPEIQQVTWLTRYERPRSPAIVL